MSHVTIRLAEDNDFAAVSTLLAELGRPPVTPETIDAAQSVFLRHIADPNTASRVAEMDGIVIGFLSLVFREHLNYIQPLAWIPDLIVTESARGQGAARKLLESAFEAAHDAGCQSVRLESGYQRTVAHQVYLAIGMSNDGYYFTKRLGE